MNSNVSRPMPRAKTGSRFLNWVSNATMFLLQMERRIDPWLRRIFNATLRDPRARIVPTERMDCENQVSGLIRFWPIVNPYPDVRLLELYRCWRRHAAATVSRLPQFVTVRGDGYLFLPSLRALRYFARV